MTSCAYQCHEIGGPWIAENPDCPEHGAAGRAAREEKEDRFLKLEQRVTDLEDEIRRLRSRAGILPRGARY